MPAISYPAVDELMALKSIKGTGYNFKNFSMECKFDFEKRTDSYGDPVTGAKRIDASLL